MVGMTGFEPAASSSRTKRASQAALHPDTKIIKIITEILVRDKSRYRISSTAEFNAYGLLSGSKILNYIRIVYHFEDV